MTLQEIYDILDANIRANGGTLKQSPTTISSPEISGIFNTYLLNHDLVVKEAQLELNEGLSVTVNGKGDSLIFFQTDIDQLVFTVDEEGIPSMAIKANAIIAGSGGWTFGASFPLLKNSNWGGFKDPKDDKKWIQYIFFESGEFTLDKTGLSFRGILLFKNGLEPLSVIFKGWDKVMVRGSIAISQGEPPFTPTPETVMPVMFLKAEIGQVTLPLGSFTFSLTFGMKASAFIVPDGDNKGKPGAILEMLIQSTLPINNEEVGIAVSTGTQAGALTFRAVLPEHTEIGMAELISLANNANVLAAMPSNIPIINDFVLGDWQLTFNTKLKSITQMSLKVNSRTGFSWTLIPGYITLEALNFWLNVSYFNSRAETNLTIEGTIGFGTPPNRVLYDVSASFPSYVFMGSLNQDTPIDLRGLLVYYLGEGIADSLPDTLKIGSLDITIDSKNSTYSLATSLTTDLEIPMPLTTITILTVNFNIDFVAGQGTGSMGGSFKVGKAEDSPEFEVLAAYNGPEDGWLFSGGLSKGSKIALKPIIDTYLPEPYRQFNVFDIEITTLYVTINQGPNKQYDFSLGGSWLLDLGLGEGNNPRIDALTKITYKSSLPEAAQYTGFVEGSLNFGNIKVGARVDFKDKYNDYTFFFNAFQAKLTHNPAGDSIIEFSFTDNTTLGDLITLLVNASTGQDITLPAPWNVMNNIKMKDFGFFFNITKKIIGFSYNANINLGFINIKQFKLSYDYGVTPSKVNIQISEGSFLGGAVPLPGPWNVNDPAAAPAVPGNGDKLFRLDFLGMGQHVSLKSGLSPKSVAEAINLLKAAFERKPALGMQPAGGISPIKDTGLKFNSSSNWLIGTEFAIVDTFNIGIVFYDPDMYGLSLYVNGAKAKVFQGLRFEILYKKVSDTVGVYQIYFKLPDSIRQIDFGQVSITLPSLRLYIYTDGSFKVDMGFPLNDDFSESFGLQYLPFIGSGGFYIGFLKSAADVKLPATTKGNFSPVIVFGIGMKVGIGKEINKGILKAGLSLTLQGIVEGIFAQYNAFQGSGNQDVTYFFISGKLALVGHLYGAINFAIISAELDIKIFISLRIVVEIYEPVFINFSAGVSVSLRVKINLGIFSFSINLSFSTTISASFTIGSRQPKPWNAAALSNRYRVPMLTALDADEECPIIPAMNWQPVLPGTPVDLAMLYIAQFTVATDPVTLEQQPRISANLYLESSIDQPTPTRRVTRMVNGSLQTEQEEYPFTRFAKGVFYWAIGAYINKTNEGIPLETILSSTITIVQLKEMLCYFSTGKADPFTTGNIIDFMAAYFNITITVPPRQVQGNNSASIFPMLPLLELDTPGGTIYFDDERAKYVYTEKQLAEIHALFRALSVNNLSNNNASQRSANQYAENNEVKKSLANYVLTDFISLLAKEAIQRGLDQLEAMTVEAPQEQSLNEWVAAHPQYGISAAELAFSNRNRPLAHGRAIRVKNIHYTVKEGDTHQRLAQRFALTENLMQQHYGSQVPAPGTRLHIPELIHTSSADNNDTLLSIAHHYGIPVHDCIESALDTPGLFMAGKRLRVPNAEATTVSELVAAMDQHHDFEHMSGLSANIMLQGLRVPLPEGDNGIGRPEAMFLVTGQQLYGQDLVLGQQLTLQVPEALSWLNLGSRGGTSLPYTLEEEDIAGMKALAGAQLKPSIDLLQALPLDDVQPKRYTLPTPITWQIPQTAQLAAGAQLNDPLGDPAIWLFKNSLQALISGQDAISPKVALLKQVQETPQSAAKPTPIDRYSWATTINLTLRTVRQAADPTQLMPNVYEVQSIDQESMGLLQNLLDYYGRNPGSNIIDQLNILYSKEPAREGQTEPPSGLRSDSINNTSVFVLQTNLSTLSNPNSLRLAAAEAAPGGQSNILGMTVIDLLRYLWEASVVGTGGYYLYYLVKDSKAGLPDYIFNSDQDGIVTLVVTYRITDNVLSHFLNSAVIADPIDTTTETLYVETLARAVPAYDMSGSTLAETGRRFRTSISGIALQNQHAPLAKGLTLQIPGGASHTTRESDTLARLAQGYRVTVIALAHANKNIKGLYAEPVGFDSRIEVKVATVPAGNIGFTMSRQNPETRNEPEIDKALEELYNLLQFNIAASTDFLESPAALPVAPNKGDEAPENDPDVFLRPTAVGGQPWEYKRVFPVYPYAKTNPPGKSILTAIYAWESNRLRSRQLTEADIPPEIENPYRAVGKTVQTDMRWLDLFGNLTKFTNTGNQPVLAPILIGYIDAVLGLNQYPSITGAYIVEKNEQGNPSLRITLAFNPSKYQPVDEQDEGWRERARVDRDTYRLIYYQLLQEDMTLTITNTLQPEALKPDGDPKTMLQTLVLEIYQYLTEILQPDPPPVTLHQVKAGENLAGLAGVHGISAEDIRKQNPALPFNQDISEGQVLRISEAVLPQDQVIRAPLSDGNPENLFAVVTNIRLSRNLDLVDDNFKDEPSVLFADAALGPNLKSTADGEEPRDSITIQEFAQKMQDAFPQLRVASGLSQASIENDRTIDIWVMRFDTSNKGVQFNILNRSNPFYFAVQPLSTFLLSNPAVWIYPYTTGIPIYQNKPAQAAFNGVDLERMAEAFLQAIDNFLLADFSIPAWIVENNRSPLPDTVPDPYQQIIEAKRLLAENISNHLETVLVDGNTPTPENLRAARERLRQQLLIRLSDAYTINTVLQFNVNVNSPYTDAKITAPNLFGKVLDPNDNTPPEQKAYAFSTTRFSLEKSGPKPADGDPLSYLTILFNTKKENIDPAEKSYFPIDLQYQISSIEHDIHPIAGIQDYKASGWLTFILPFQDASSDLGNLKIPIPLRVYPTSPSLTAQNFTTDTPQFKGSKMLLAGEDKLHESKIWNYNFTYDYLRAQQDTIYTDILLNVMPNAAFRATMAEEDPDLFAALLQFTSAYPGIQEDLNRYLASQSDPNNAFTAMQSLAWLAGRVARAWGAWKEEKQFYREAGDRESPNYRYEITEGTVEYLGEILFNIVVRPRAGTNFQLPDIDIPGFIRLTLTDLPAEKSFVYYTEVEGVRKFLQPGDAKNLTERMLIFSGFNIIMEENAWSGLSIVRNKVLVPDIPTNPDFIYETPVVRFVNILTPLLDPSVEINMADYTSLPAPQPLQLYLSNFMQAFFAEIATQTTARQIKLNVSYSYNLLEGEEALRATLPVTLLTPYSFSIPADWLIDKCPADASKITPADSMVCQLSAFISNWFKTNNPLKHNGRFLFDLSLFSGLSDTQLPVLRIRNIYLDINHLDLQ